MEKTIQYNLNHTNGYDSVETTDAIIILHGGGFSAGSHNYDEKLAKLLAKDYYVYRPNFSLNSLNDSLNDLINFVSLLSYKHKKINLCGISSGGFIALKLIEKFNGTMFNSLVLVCPVINPYERYLYALENNKNTLVNKTLKYFKDITSLKTQSKLNFYFIKTTLIYGGKDKNIPENIIIKNLPLNLVKSSYLNLVKFNDEDHKLCTKEDKIVNAI